MAQYTGPRVLVHLRSRGQTRVAKFSECILEYVHRHEKTDELSKTNEGIVSCSLEDGKLVLERATTTSSFGLRLRHPERCPAKMMTWSDISELPDDIAGRGINVGVCAILESADKCVLLTRRAAHMRTFPGIWVPPGGGIDFNETLLQAGQRELLEETGLDINDSEIQSSRILCLWESVYPPYLSRGQPKRHHIVVYFHIILTQDQSSLNPRIVIQREEVDAVAWLNKGHIDYCLNGTKCDSNLQVIVPGYDKEQKVIESKLEFLRAEAPDTGPDVERVSSGTLFALSEWHKSSAAAAH